MPFHCVVYAQMADEAGILWTEDTRHPNAPRHTGADDRPPSHQPPPQMYHPPQGYSDEPPVAQATVAYPTAAVYRPDGSVVR